MDLWRQVRIGGQRHADGDRRDVVGRGIAVIAELPQDIDRVRERVEDAREGDDRADAVETKVKDVTIPKFPPPPRIAQKRSGFESADAVRT